MMWLVVGDSQKLRMTPGVRIVAGEADALAGRIVYVGDDIDALSERSHEDHVRRLRIQTDR